ncbi:MAG: leishmanolysin-related zinc metalloendopeptidase [Gemmatimonadaceae bacterium]
MLRLPPLSPALPLALVFISIACGESTGPPKPSSIAADVTTVADGTAGIVLSPQTSFVVKDGNGNTMGGVSITIAVTAGGGTLANAPTQTAAGAPTPVGQWTLGTVAGVNSVTVTVAGLAPLVITVNGRPGPPASVAFISGLDQTALAGNLLPTAPVAQVRDQFNNGVPGVVVLFAVVDGEGFLSSSSVTTNASGNALAPQWRLGKSAIPQTLRATAGAFSANLSATVSTDYLIDLRFHGPPMPLAAEAAFTAAAARIRGAVVGDVPNINVGAGVDLTVCGLPGVFLSGIIDDVVIYGSVMPMDGRGGVLARAGPCFVREVGSQTVVGIMQFDSDDIQPLIDNGRLRDVIQHEMLHVIGIGTLWNTYGVLAGAGTAEPRYTGTLGVAACIAIGGAAVCPTHIPVENQGGAGTIDSHWRESVFVTELMTGFLGSVNPLSAMSIQSLGDIGYVTNQSAADPYTIPGQSASSILGDFAEPLHEWEETMLPVFKITPAGRVTRIKRL